MGESLGEPTELTTMVEAGLRFSPIIQTLNNTNTFVVGDVDLDGWPDLVSAGDGIVRVEFGMHHLGRTLKIGDVVTDLAIADLDRRGYREVAVGTASRGVHIVSIDEDLRLHAGAALGQPANVAQILAADLGNELGSNDLVVVDGASGDVVGYRQQAAGFDGPLPILSGWTSPKVGVAQRDRHPGSDLVVVSPEQENALEIYRALAPDVSTEVNQNLSSYATVVATGDVNRSGLDDIVTFGEYLQVATEGWSPQHEELISVNAVAIGDLDGDGRPDIVVASGSEIRVMKQVGDDCRPPSTSS